MSTFADGGNQCRPVWPALHLVYKGMDVVSILLKGWIYDDGWHMWEIRRIWQYILRWKELNIGPTCLTTFSEWCFLSRVLFGVDCILPSLSSVAYWDSKGSTPWPVNSRVQGEWTMATPAFMMLLVYMSVRRVNRPEQVHRSKQMLEHFTRTFLTPEQITEMHSRAQGTSARLSCGSACEDGGCWHVRAACAKLACEGLLTKNLHRFPASLIFNAFSM